MTCPLFVTASREACFSVPNWNFARPSCVVTVEPSAYAAGRLPASILRPAASSAFPIPVPPGSSTASALNSGLRSIIVWHQPVPIAPRIRSPLRKSRFIISVLECFGVMSFILRSAQPRFANNRIGVELRPKHESSCEPPEDGCQESDGLQAEVAIRRSRGNEVHSPSGNPLAPEPRYVGGSLPFAAHRGAPGGWAFSARRSLPLSQPSATPLSFVRTAHIRDNIATILSRRVFPGPHAARLLATRVRSRAFCHCGPCSVLPAFRQIVQ